MWARVIEFMLACWLAISPFIFSYPKDALFFWFNDLTCSSFIAIFSLVCFYTPLRKMHLCNLVIAFYLMALSYFFRAADLYEPLQNYMVLGILLLMIAVVPAEADKPPVPWRKFYKK